MQGYRDEVMRSLHAAVRINAEGNIQGAVVSWIASASPAASKRKDEGHLPVTARGISPTTHSKSLAGCGV